MAEWETKEGEHPVTMVKIKLSEKIALCRCFGSKEFPLCDGTHKDYPGKGPVIIEATEEIKDS